MSIAFPIATACVYIATTIQLSLLPQLYFYFVVTSLQGLLVHLLCMLCDGTQNVKRYRYRDFFSGTKSFLYRYRFFFRDKNFRFRDFFDTKFYCCLFQDFFSGTNLFRYRFWYHQKNEQFSVPGILGTGTLHSCMYKVLFTNVYWVTCVGLRHLYYYLPWVLPAPGITYRCRVALSVILTLGIACAWPFGWSQVLKTISPMFPSPPSSSFQYCLCFCAHVFAIFI